MLSNCKDRVLRNKVFISIFIVFCCFFLSAIKVWAVEYAVTQFTNNEYNNYFPSISNGQIAWYTQTPDGSGLFYLYDGHQIKPIGNFTNNPNNYNSPHPKISNGQVVWHSFDGNNDQIFLYDGGQPIPISNSGYDNFFPSISNGQIAWSGYDGNTYQIYLYNPNASPEVIPVPNPYNTIDNRSPCINNGQVAWSGYDGNGYNIYLYDPNASPEVRQISDPNTTAYNWDVNINNGKIAWAGYSPGGSYQIYLYDGGQPKPITNNALQNYFPCLDNDGKLVWESHNYSGGYHVDIFLYDSGQTTQITNAKVYSEFPILWSYDPVMNNGEIGWDSYCGTSEQIFLATPKKESPLKKVGIYYRHGTSTYGLPVAGYPTTDTLVTVRAIVWADDGSGEVRAYTQQTQDEVVNDGKWFATGSEGAQAGISPPVLKVPVLSTTEAPVIYKWPSTWPQPVFEWKNLIHRGSDSIGDTYNRNYWYDEAANNVLTSWGADNIIFSSGNQRLKVTVSLSGQSVVSATSEYSSRISVLDNTAPSDHWGTNYIKWLTTYSGVPYEWGGYWYGGKEGQNVGGAETYDGYGIDCSGLVCVGALRAGYNWRGWRVKTTTLADNYYSISVDPRNIQPGDILVWPGEHVVTIYGIKSYLHGIPDKIMLIDSEGDYLAREDVSIPNGVAVFTDHFGKYSKYQIRRLVKH